MPVPPGGSITLVDSSGNATYSIVIENEGTYTLDPTTGVITFTPVFGFYGQARPVQFEVVDAYGQRLRQRYRAFVSGSVKTTVRVGNPIVKPGKPLRVRCELAGAIGESCSVVVRAVVKGKPTVIGRGVTTKTGTKILVTVKLNKRGRDLLAHSPGGVQTVVAATITATTTDKYQVIKKQRIRGAVVKLRPILFDADEWAISRADQRYLAKVRSSMGKVSTIVCEGFADKRSTREWNKYLGQQRAAAVCAELKKRNKLVKVRSYGFTRPVASNATEDGRRLNRRTEVTLRY